MNRKYVSTLPLALLLAFAGCSDDKKPTRDGSTDAIATGDTGPLMCMGTFGALNRTQLGAVTNPAGKCAAAADLDAICSSDVGMAMRVCGQQCFLANPTRPDLVECTITCAKQQLAPKPSPSDGCLTCYGGTVSCTLMNCRDVCAADSMGLPCLKCQNEKNCLAPFFACSGLPAPTSPTTDGGTTTTDGSGSATEGGSDSGKTSDGGTPDSPATTDAAPKSDTASGVDAAAPADAAPVDAAASDAPATTADAAIDTAAASDAALTD